VDRHAGAMSARSPGLRKQVGQTFRSCAMLSWPGRRTETSDRQGGCSRVDPYLVFITFPVIFVGELP
jgi:hypothetical protein